MMPELRPPVLLPLAVLGILALVAGAFATGVLDLSADDRVESSARLQAIAEKDVKAAKERAKPTKERAKTGSREAPASKQARSGATLGRELERHGVAVVALYLPDSAVDRMAIREARAGAAAAGAGFLALDVSNERAIAPLANRFGLRGANALVVPATVVFRRGPEVVTRISGFADREIVAQASEDARP